MPLHDWTDYMAWDSLRLIWTVELLRFLKLTLPPDHQIRIESTAKLLPDDPSAHGSESQTALHVMTQGRPVAAVELISPRNKDRTTSRAFYLSRYLGYLQEGVHLLLVDVHRRPLNFSFADALAHELNLKR